jgi:predicted PurR-regulated permease PerM
MSQKNQSLSDQSTSTTKRANAASAANIAAVTIATLLVFAACFFLKVVVLPIIISYFLFVLLEPMTQWAEKKNISRTLGSSVLILLVVGVSAAIGYGSYRTCARLVEQVPQYSEKIKGSLSSLQGNTEKLTEGGSNLLPEPKVKEDIQKVEVVEKIGGDQTGKVMESVSSTFELLTIVLLIPILALFFLLDKGGKRNQ